MSMRNLEVIASTSAAVNVTSSAICVDKTPVFSLQAVTTGTAAGSLKLQASCDLGEDGAPTNWADVASSTITVTTASVNLWNIADVGYRWIRIVYTASSGTGNISARFNCNTRVP